MDVDMNIEIRQRLSACQAGLFCKPYEQYSNGSVVCVVAIGSMGRLMLKESLSGFISAAPGSARYELSSYSRILAIDNEFIALTSTPADERILVGGAGRLNDKDVKSALTGSRLVLILAGLGEEIAGTMAIKVAQVARDEHACVLAIVVTPFEIEGSGMASASRQALDSLGAVANAIIPVSAQSILSNLPSNQRVDIKHAQALGWINRVFPRVLRCVAPSNGERWSDGPHDIEEITKVLSLGDGCICGFGYGAAHIEPKMERALEQALSHYAMGTAVIRKARGLIALIEAPAAICDEECDLLEYLIRSQVPDDALVVVDSRHWLPGHINEKNGIVAVSLIVVGAS